MNTIVCKEIDAGVLEVRLNRPERMNALARHIDQANKDVQDVQVSSRKISGQFARIEGVELDGLEAPPTIAAVPLRKAGEE